MHATSCLAPIYYQASKLDHQDFNYGLMFDLQNKDLDDSVFNNVMLMT